MFSAWLCSIRRDEPRKHCLRGDAEILPETLIVWGSEFGRPPLSQGDDGNSLDIVRLDNHKNAVTRWPTNAPQGVISTRLKTPPRNEHRGFCGYTPTTSMRPNCIDLGSTTRKHTSHDHVTRFPPDRCSWRNPAAASCVTDLAAYAQAFHGPENQRQAMRSLHARRRTRALLPRSAGLSSCHTSRSRRLSQAVPCF